jgi:deaminated glutathione amidase
MTVCYDVRFPQLYRALAQAGAEVLTVPAAFSPVTGAAHWEVLLRARAIETGCYVLAPAQTGTHPASPAGGSVGPGGTRWRSRPGARCWPMPGPSRA